MKCNERKTKPILYKADQPCIYDKELCDTGIKPLDNKECDNVSKLVNDSWVKINTNEISNEKLVDVFQSLTDSQKVLYNTIISLYFCL